MTDIKERIPDYYDDVLEMAEIMDANDDSLEHLNTDIAMTFLNLFVLKADSEGLRILEEMYGLGYDSTLSLETRRYNLIVKLLPPRPITIRYFRELVNSIAKNTKVTDDALASSIDTELSWSDVNDDNVNKVKEMMAVYLPVHLTQKIRKLNYFDTKVNNFIGVANELKVVESTVCKDDIFAFETTARSFIGTVNKLKVRSVSFCKDSI